MDSNSINHNTYERMDESTIIRDMVEKYLLHFKWFLLSVLMFLLLAYLYNKFSVPKYSVKASILIKDKSDDSSFEKLSSIDDFGFFGTSNSSLENEIQLLQSRTLLTKVVEELDLTTQYFLENYAYDIEIYPNYPIILNLNHEFQNNINSNFEIHVKSKRKFDFIQFDGEVIKNISYGDDFMANLGNEEISNMISIEIMLNNNYVEDILGKRIKVYLKPLSRVVDSYMGKIEIKPVNEKLSNVISLSITETVKNKGEAILNNLIEQFNADAINDKNLISKTTTNFLDERLELISAELTAIEETAAQFKTSKGMLNANAEANYFLQSSTVTESEMVDAKTQLQLVDYMFAELNNSNLTDPLPGNIGLADPSIVNMIGEYNQQILQRNRILKSSSTKNPIIVNIDSQLGVLRNNLVSSLNNLKSSSQIKISALNRKSGKISSKIATAPKFEMEFKDIVRKQETKNALYLFLLQKREESILSNAVKVQKSKVIDMAYSNGIPISPKKKLIYMASLLLGLIFPVVVIYILNILDTKVHDENDLKKINIPYLGDIPISNSNKELFISNNDDSSIAESFRYLRTNINFMLDRKKSGKTIYVTSTQSGEGKTFASINLAFSLAISGKKTLLLGFDLRSPKIASYLGINNITGVSNFVKDETIKIEDLVRVHEGFDNLHIINSGDVPPNPVELLMSVRIEEIFEYANENYDYIVVDTAPVGMVTDTLQISKFSDLTVYVIKANYLDKRLLHIPEKLNAENKLPNMAFLINGSNHSKGAYGYGYGYGKKDRSSWYKKIIGQAAM